MIAISTSAAGGPGNVRGWIGYFGACDTPSVLRSLEEWTRRRLRSAIGKQWRQGTTRYAELRRRGVGVSPALTRALPKAYVDSLGMPRLTVRC